MSKAQHTLGPWYLDGTDVISYSQGLISCAYTLENPETKELERNSECLANARLIAAAPELLEALETIMHEYFWKNQTGPAMDKARAAILKAKGLKAKGEV